MSTWLPTSACPSHVASHPSLVPCLDSNVYISTCIGVQINANVSSPSLIVSCKDVQHCVVPYTCTSIPSCPTFGLECTWMHDHLSPQTSSTLWHNCTQMCTPVWFSVLFQSLHCPKSSYLILGVRANDWQIWCSVTAAQATKYPLKTSKQQFNPVKGCSIQ